MKTDTPGKFFVLILCLVVGSLLTACGGGGSSSGGGTGTVSTSLTDSSTDEYQAVYVTIARVDVHLGGGLDDQASWQTIATPNKTYNLLELVNGAREHLNLATLPTGHYTQMRLIISDSLPQTTPPGINVFNRPHPHANYVIDQGTFTTDEGYLSLIHELKVPSGPNTGFKIVNGFDINLNETTELILDFDASRSVVVAGKSGQYLLKPTVKVLSTDFYAIVQGKVSDTATPPVALEGASVTTQTETDIEAATQTGALIGEINYMLFVVPGTYKLVATKDGYFPGCVAMLPLLADSVTTENFNLDATATGLITVSVTIAGAPQDQYATIDFRREIPCGSTPSVVTLKSINLVNGGSYSVSLPAGNYQIVASTAGRAPQSTSSDTSSLTDPPSVLIAL